VPDFRDIIRAELDRLDWSVADLHRKVVRTGADISYNTVRRYLAGETKLAADTLGVVFDVLGIIAKPVCDKELSGGA